MITPTSANAAASYPIYSYGITHTSQRTPAQLVEEKAKRDYEDSLAKCMTSAVQVSQAAIPVFLAPDVLNRRILPELPSELLAIIASYENRIIEADPRVVPYILNGLVKALTGKPQFETEIRRIREVIELHSQTALKNVQIQMPNILLEIFDPVRTNLSQLSLQQIQEAFTRLKSNQVQTPAIESLFQQHVSNTQESSIGEADQKERLAMTIPDRFIDADLYIELCHLLADSAIQESFDGNLLKLQDCSFLSELRPLMETAEFFHQSITEKAKVVREWLSQEHPEWQKITEIHISCHPRLTQLSWELIAILKRMAHLKKLNFTDNRLIILPEAIGNLTQLKELDLSSNWLTTLPDAIGDLSQLQKLYLINNRFTNLPEAICCLTQLETLYLSDNQLKTLPEAIGGLTQLTTFYVGGNKLTTLPDAIGSLIHLETLIVHNNELMTLPDAIGNLSHLKELHLGGNKLMMLPDGIGNLFHLSVLNISQNQLRTLPDTFGNLTQLQLLDLVFNKLTTLPDTIGNLAQLIGLALSFNELTALPDTIGNLAQLQAFNLHGNKLNTIPHTIGNLIQLRLFVLAANELTTLPDSIGNLTQLQGLNLCENWLTTLPYAIGNLTQLTELYLSNNILTTLPDSIGKLTQLQKLHLNSNTLISLPDTIGNLIQLKEFKLGSNLRLTTMPDTIGCLARLRFLELQHFDLNDNAFTTFTTLPRSLTAIRSLQDSIRTRDAELFYQGIPIEPAKKNSWGCSIC